MGSEKDNGAMEGSGCDLFLMLGIETMGVYYDSPRVTRILFCMYLLMLCMTHGYNVLKKQNNIKKEKKNPFDTT